MLFLRLDMDVNRDIRIMGIVNVTDDSYFAESRCSGADAALLRVERMLSEGADIIDIGACSTRPGAISVGETEEWRRLAPVLSVIRKEFPHVVISVDTYWSSVVKRAYESIGDIVVNDISAGEDDSQMLDLVGHLNLTYIAMHKRGTPLQMQQLTDYKDVVADVMEYFVKFSKKAAEAGIKNWILDPGFGFSKTVNQNWELLRGLPVIKTVENAYGNTPPLLVGMSRKSMIYRLLDITPEESLPATQVAHYAALCGGADILRVHDVAEAVRTVKLYRNLFRENLL